MKYSNVAIFIHWLTALAIIGLLAVGKFMVDLGDTDPLRFTLTQSHKTFGILVLALSFLRILWRLTHKAPPHPAGSPGWEKFAANVSHFVFYLLLFILPLSGWAMVSVSPLNIDTLLFDRINLPHLPLNEWLGLANTSAQQLWEHRFHEVHHVAGNVLAVLLLIHIGAALKHHFIDKDDVLHHMTPRWSDERFWNLIGALLLVIGASFYALNHNPGSSDSATALVAQSSRVSLQAMVSGAETNIEFSTAEVMADLDLNSPANSTLQASVDTGTLSSDNSQVEGSLPDADWFDVASYPQATFTANSFAAGQEVNTLDVTGELTVKDTTVPVSFTLVVDQATDAVPAKASTQFEVDRFELKLGEASQPDDTWVGGSVIVFVEFELSAGN